MTIMMHIHSKKANIRMTTTIVSMRARRLFSRPYVKSFARCCALSFIRVRRAGQRSNSINLFMAPWGESRTDENRLGNFS